jgi:predicted lipid-binding transport protein (Tim44 family)
LRILRVCGSRCKRTGSKASSHTHTRRCYGDLSPLLLPRHCHAARKSALMGGLVGGLMGGLVGGLVGGLMGGLVVVWWVVWWGV